MGLFSRLIDTAAKVVTTPLAVAQDVVTLGGLATGRNETYTETKLRDTAEAIEETIDELT